VLCLVAAPGCLLAAGSALALVLAAFGRHPMWPDVAVNLSEAAATRNEAEVVRLIGAGENPNESREVRAGLLFDRDEVPSALDELRPHGVVPQCDDVVPPWRDEE
jgi:hypothetical protein